MKKYLILIIVLQLSLNIAQDISYIRYYANEKEFIAPQGSLIFIPANAPHSIVATEEEDVIFLALKDLSHSIIGMAVDGTMSGPHYEPGFKPASSASQV